MSIDAFAAWAGIFLCLSQSAMLSGLNLACFSVSRLQLEMEAFRNNEDAVKVLRLRKDSNFLLTTILWGNVGVNTLLALLSGSVLGGIAAFLFSTVFITVFAEIFPQSYFSRNALRMASLLSPVVRFYQFLLYPVAKPTAKILDLWLGPEGVHYVTRNPDDTLERVLTHGNLSENQSPDRGVILLWGEEKRIISHFDVLKRLFEGVVTPVPLHRRRTPGR